MLSTITVVDIPVEDQYFFKTTLSLQVFGRDCDIVEDAKAQCSIVFSVVAGWPDQCKPIVCAPCDHFIDNIDQAASCQECSVVGGCADGNIWCIEVWQAGTAGGFSSLPQRGIMNLMNPLEIACDGRNRK